MCCDNAIIDQHFDIIILKAFGNDALVFVNQQNNFN